ncbi:transcription termination factor 2 isoform X1 [Culex quinquefasciatus]|uniref:transcription termination factor 2 isoform X1 n=1 Tax=Culex quinquefasciatus TaxID=7176 RepID=UPI0018E2C995|nr:transcription termination factor 2 isoform X1 [Culex quinquefasciatus]
MSDSEDIFVGNTSDEEEYASVNSSVQEPESIIIEETDDDEHVEEEEEEERMLRERLKKRQSRRMSFHPKRSSSSSSSSKSEAETVANESSSDEYEVEIKPGPVKVSVKVRSSSESEAGSDASGSETDDEERSMDARALSPRTRMSISGIRPEDMTSDEDDEIIMQRKKTGGKRNVLVSDEEDEQQGEREDSFDESLPMRSFDAEGNKRESISSKLSSTVVSDDVKDTSRRDSISTKLSSTAVSEEELKDELGNLSIGGRLSTSVRQSIGNKLSSTALNSSEQHTSDLKSDDTSSIALIEKTAEVVTLSSDDEKPDKPTTLVQSTIRAAFAKQQVSQSFYESKQRKLADSQQSLATMEKLMLAKNSLPDKGVNLMKRIVKAKEELAGLAKELNGLEVQESKSLRNEIRQSFESTNNSLTSANASVKSVKDDDKVINISWDDIKKAADQIVPVHTGKQGMATFENQKTLTMGRLETLHKSIETCPTEDTYAEPPKLLKIELMNHQLHALAWMMWRESQKPRGGILADDMGLGKTLSMISLILKSAETDDPDKELEESDSDEEEDNNAGWKAKGRKDYYAGGTLVVCPASLMRQWEGEITTRVARNSMAVSVYHGTNRDAKSRHLAKYDVVITTYNIVAREGKGDRGGLFGVNWERIILDEAHTIRNHKTAVSVGCCALKGRYRWALTGTPIQNKEMDIYALLKFLRCTPFDDLNHWKKWIDNKTAGGMVRLNTIMKSLMLRRTKQQLKEKGAIQCLPEKNIELIEVQLSKDEMNVYQRVLLYSRTLFSQFLHQRTEKENANHYGYAGSQATYAQNRQPNGAFDRVHQKLKQLHTKDDVKQHEILVLLLRLRQICCHPGLIHKMLDDDEGNFHDVSGNNEEAPELDLLAQLNNLKLTDPDDAANNDSTGALRELNISDQLPENTEALSKASSKVMMRSNPVFDMDRVSSKIGAVIRLLDERVLKTSDKAVVVSQWSSMLEIVAQQLRVKGVRFTALTGAVPVKLRNDLVVEFNKEGAGPKIMLLSLTAGGVGLNLVGANHLMLLDLHWNPQLEAQAQDRVYRVGQKKPVYIWKFMCTDTVEQKIIGLQQKKLDLATQALTGTKHTGSKLTIDDLKSLFGL